MSLVGHGWRWAKITSRRSYRKCVQTLITDD
jgi:hypothetical protein